jgi:hypothetical protein
MNGGQRFAVIGELARLYRRAPNHAIRRLLAQLIVSLVSQEL